MTGAREFHVIFSNLNGCAIGISDIMWSAVVTAESEDEAIGLAIDQARLVNNRTGLPPHGIVVSYES
jgi:hypothetical protein